MPQAAKLPAETGPLAAAEAAQQEARAEAETVTARLNDLLRGGPPVDELKHQRLKGALESALKALRHADLDVEEQKAAATAPISVKVLGKIRVMRRHVADLHPSLMVRMAETNRLRAHRSGLENAIAELRRSAEFVHDERELRRVFRGDAGGHAATTRSGKQLAQLERDLERTIAEAALAATVQAEASAKWTNAKSTLDAWESAVRAQGPAAARALLELPRAGVIDDQNLRGYADISAGENQTPINLHESGKYAGRAAAVE